MDIELINASNELQRSWQKHWREALGEPTDDMPEDVSCDFALHFDIWTLDDRKLSDCFTLFPEGLKMLERAQELRSIVPAIKPIDDAVLLKHLEDTNIRVESVISKTRDKRAIAENAEKKAVSRRTVYRGDEAYRLEVFKSTDAVTVALDAIVGDLFMKNHGDVGYAAFRFLCEPFYQISSYTVIRNAILWAALIDVFDEDPYESIVELYKVSAQAGWSNDELFVFIKQ